MARKVKRDAVLKRDGESRKDRSDEDRVMTENREVTDEERLDLLRQSYFQSALPDLPKIPGYHTCWLSTQNPRDPIHGRLRLGYTLLKGSEIPGWEHSTSRGGEFDGVISVNEMIAAKLPIRLFEKYMATLHHEQPLFEEAAIKAKQQNQQEEAASLGAQLIPEQGQRILGVDPGVSSFAEQYGED
jgi:hypothetical protein